MNGDQFNPVTVVVAQLSDRLAAVPFKPFDIVMSNGVRHLVPTADHLTITRLLRRICLEHDNLRLLEINPLHVATIEDHQDAA